MRKVCCKCKVEKEIDNFHFFKDKPHGYCKQCKQSPEAKQYQKQYQRKKREYNGEYAREYYRKNSIEIIKRQKEYQKEWRKNNKEYCKSYMSRYANELMYSYVSGLLRRRYGVDPSNNMIEMKRKSLQLKRLINEYKNNTFEDQVIRKIS